MHKIYSSFFVRSLKKLKKDIIKQREKHWEGISGTTKRKWVQFHKHI